MQNIFFFHFNENNIELNKERHTKSLATNHTYENIAPKKCYFYMDFSVESVNEKKMGGFKFNKRNLHMSKHSHKHTNTRMNDPLLLWGAFYLRPSSHTLDGNIVCV